MKKSMKLTRRFLALLIMAILMVSCSQDEVSDGNIGPQGVQGEQGSKGEQGEQGQVGPEGPAGQAGEQGEPGLANVIYSDWLEAKPYVFDEPGYSYVDKDAPEITTEIMDTGTILAYFKLDSSVRILPWDAGIRLAFFIPEAGKVRFTISDGGTDELDLPGNPKYRYVIIPGGIPSTGKSESPNYTKMSYEEIAAHFTISD